MKNYMDRILIYVPCDMSQCYMSDIICDKNLIGTFRVQFSRNLITEFVHFSKTVSKRHLSEFVSSWKIMIRIAKTPFEGNKAL